MTRRNRMPAILSVAVLAFVLRGGAPARAPSLSEPASLVALWVAGPGGLQKLGLPDADVLVEDRSATGLTAATARRLGRR